VEALEKVEKTSEKEKTREKSEEEKVEKRSDEKSDVVDGSVEGTNPFSALAETKEEKLPEKEERLPEKCEGRSPEQEEIRRRRLAVFEEQKKRLSHKKD